MILSVRIPEALMIEAKQIASIDGITFSELVRIAIADYLKNHCNTVEFRNRLDARIEKDKRILDRLKA